MFARNNIKRRHGVKVFGTLWNGVCKVGHVSRLPDLANTSPQGAKNVDAMTS